MLTQIGPDLLESTSRIRPGPELHSDSRIRPGPELHSDWVIPKKLRSEYEEKKFTDPLPPPPPGPKSEPGTFHVIPCPICRVRDGTCEHFDTDRYGHRALMICFYCRGQHWFSTCPHRDDVSYHTCFSCFKHGDHFSRDCPLRDDLNDNGTMKKMKMKI